MTHAPARLRIGKKGKGTVTALAWVVCSRCGLVYLRNAATAAAVRAPCPGKDDD